MSISGWEFILIAVILAVLFGRGKISALMGDVAKGIKSFKTGLAEEPEEKPAAAGKPRPEAETPVRDRTGISAR